MSADATENTEPVALEGDDAGVYARQVAPQQRQKPSAAMWFGLGFLVVVALAVVFVLPSVVSEYELPLERRIEEATQPVASAPSQQAAAVSPFEEAQRSIRRKQAQDVLAELLEKQGQLDALEVASWGEADYDAALEIASIGDEYYRTQDFELAISSYSEGNDVLAELLARIPEVLAQTLIDGDNALADGISQLAQDRYSLALVLDPDSEAAQIGLGRARTLDQVQLLMQQAEELRENSDLEAARSLLQEIVSLDPYNETAPLAIAEVDAEIRENEFSQIMSEGYLLLQADDPESAIAAFQRAAAMGINVQEAEAAIRQTETEVANAQIARLRIDISSAEADERWSDAVAAYDQVIAIDGNLLFAQEGRELANQRMTLDQLLVTAIESPERFSDQAVYEETLRYYFIGRDLGEPGPLLSSQLDELQALLENSQVPVGIVFLSDTFTEVTLLRIGTLGVFSEMTMDLKPGNYVAVGRRPGYRDVREEFTVGFGQTPDAVVVQCDERVVTTNR